MPSIIGLDSLDTFLILIQWFYTLWLAPLLKILLGINGFLVRHGDYAERSERVGSAPGESRGRGSGARGWSKLGFASGEILGNGSWTTGGTTGMGGG